MVESDGLAVHWNFVNTTDEPIVHVEEIDTISLWTLDRYEQLRARTKVQIGIDQALHNPNKASRKRGSGRIPS